jgi:hypothetical protein
VTIDGDLSDWDLSGTFEARCSGPFAESYYVHGSMMYDEQHLYVAARVGDPMPMRNVIDPNTDPWSAWMGGSVQLRLSTDRTFGWPNRSECGRSSSATCFDISWVATRPLAMPRRFRKPTRFMSKPVAASKSLWYRS